MHVVIDTRDKKPYTFDGRHRMSYKALPAGDYSLHGYTKLMAVERKNLADFLINCGVKQRLFRNQLSRLAQLRHAAVIVEGDLYGFCPFTRLSSFARVPIVAQLVAEFKVPIVFVRDRIAAQRFTESFLRHAKRQIDNA